MVSVRAFNVVWCVSFSPLSDCGLSNGALTTMFFLFLPLQWQRERATPSHETASLPLFFFDLRRAQTVQVYIFFPLSTIIHSSLRFSPTLPPRPFFIHPFICIWKNLDHPENPLCSPIEKSITPHTQ